VVLDVELPADDSPVNGHQLYPGTGTPSAFLTGSLLSRMAALDARIEEAIGPFCRPAARLADIPGVSTVAAAELIAEIGVDMTRFPSAAHLVSWAKFCPQIHQSAGKSISKGQPRATLGWPAPWAASRSSTRAPTPSWAPATGAWPDGAASRRRSSLPAIRY
jgi:hypothetical protein